MASSVPLKFGDLMDLIVWIVLAAIAVIVIGGILIYNGLIQRSCASTRPSPRSSPLKRRWDLIPNLVNA